MRQLATMMSAGVPLVQSFEIIGRGHENPSMQELVLTIKADVESGSTLASALGVSDAEWLALNSVKLPGEASKDGYVQLLMTIRNISTT